MRQSRICRSGLASLLLFLFVAGSLAGTAGPVYASLYQQTNLVSDIPGLAANFDPDLQNPWGVSHSATSPFWVSDNGAGKSTLYSGTGVEVFPVPGPPPSPVTIATPTGQTPGTATPTGQVFNSALGANDFVVSSGGLSGKATFIFATEDGTISGWTNTLTPRPAQSFLAVDNSSSGAVYKGLAIATNASGSFLYAANFASGKIDVFDHNFAPATLSGNFTDPNPLPPLPAGGQGWAPFNVQTLKVGGQDHLFITYAVQAGGGGDDLAGPGNGFVDEFDTNGNFIRRVATGGVLNSPWGLDIAPDGFGDFANDLLVGNFGDGAINVFDPNTGANLGELEDAFGNPIVIDGLWALANGNGGPAPNGSDANAVYFAAGINGEENGLFGTLTLVPEPGSLALLMTGLTGLMWFRRRRPRHHVAR